MNKKRIHDLNARFRILKVSLQILHHFYYSIFSVIGKEFFSPRKKRLKSQSGTIASL